MEANMIEELTSNRLDCKERVKKRQLHMQEYERQQGTTYIIPEGTDKINQRSQGVRFEDAKCMINHYKRCVGERTVHGKKECEKCMKLISKANISRHRLSCQTRGHDLTEMQSLPARVYKAERK